jgi:hypothetical protein
MFSIKWCKKWVLRTRRSAVQHDVVFDRDVAPSVDEHAARHRRIKHVAIDLHPGRATCSRTKVVAQLIVLSGRSQLIVLLLFSPDGGDPPSR